MTSAAHGNERREILVAALLRYGTWFASALIAAGVILTMIDLPGSPPAPLATGHAVMTAGVAVFILLPIARVALLLALFARERDYVYAAIAALVLAIIAAGVIVEM